MNRAISCVRMAAALGALLLAAPVAAQGFGKGIDLIVGMPPAGGEDTYARLLQRHWGRHLPNSPNIVVQNMPGAGSLRSVIAVNQAADDGSIVGMFSSSLIIEAVANPERVLDLRNFTFVGNISEDIRVCYVRAPIGVKSLEELRKAEKVTFGATARGTSGNIDAAMLRNLFGIQIRQIDGYSGSAEKRLAVEKGEIDGDCGGFTSVPKDWLRDSKIHLLIRLSPTLVEGLDPAIPFGGDLLKDPNERQIYDFLTAPERLGRLFMVRKSVPAERVATMRTAFEATMKDPAFLADAAKIGLTVLPNPGESVDRRIAELYQTPKELIQRARVITGE